MHSTSITLLPPVMPAADSYKHKKSSRVLIPSHEEAGAEDASPKVAGSSGKAEIPKNPVVRRGQDPELFWLGKYGADDSEDILRTDIRSLYRHEHIAPEKIISGLYRLTEGGRLAEEQMELSFDVAATFGNAITRDDLEKVSDYYTHSDGWTNRLTQGDSLLRRNFRNQVVLPSRWKTRWKA